jgi:hypothetical protein
MKPSQSFEPKFTLSDMFNGFDGDIAKLIDTTALRARYALRSLLNEAELYVYYVLLDPSDRRGDIQVQTNKLQLAFNFAKRYHHYNSVYEVVVQIREEIDFWTKFSDEKDPAPSV